MVSKKVWVKEETEDRPLFHQALLPHEAVLSDKREAMNARYLIKWFSSIADAQHRCRLFAFVALGAGKHTIFGRIKTGMGVIKRMGTVTTDAHDKPTQSVKIFKAVSVSTS